MRARGRGLVAAAAICSAPFLLGCGRAAGGDGAILVLAAASTIDAMEAAVSDFESGAGVTVDVSFGPTSTLARQVEQGAPADLVLAASRDWGDYLTQRVAVRNAAVLVGNRLVVVVPRAADGGGATGIAGFVTDSTHRRFALADPSSVPAGIYARQALEAMGLWEQLAGRLVPTIDVRAAAALVAAGEVDGGIVYATDAAGTDDVVSIGAVDPAFHEPIEYPLLLLEGAAPGADELYEFLLSARGRRHFLDRGFAPWPD